MGTVRLVKVYNNNVALAEDAAGDEVVVMGRGLAFQHRPGDLIDEGAVERRFVLHEQRDADGLARLLGEIAPDDLAVIEAVVAHAVTELRLEDGGHLFLPLADHIAFALRRARDGTHFVYPLRTEVALLYPREVEVARRALQLIRERRGVDLSDIEATPLALHFVNAQIGASGDVSAAVEMTETIAAVLELVGDRFHVQLSDEGIEVARFVTHLRYLFLRQSRGTLFDDDQGALLAALESSEPEAVAVALEVQNLLTERMRWQTSLDERVYLTLHVARLARRSDTTEAPA